MAPAQAETQVQQALLRPGNVVVTGFSGTRLADQGGDASKASADGITIETNGASLRILDVSGVNGPGADPATDATEIAAYNARVLGQVFGVALDDAVDPATKSPAPNIYTTASSAYGLNIVLPPDTDNGWPRRTLGGDQAANWMDGQWGQGQSADGKPVAGGPGSVWRIDGVTGQVTLFATIATNGQPTGAASLGNIAYDPTSHQFFVSDLESGLVHRLSLTGQDLGTFDHGVNARGAAQLPPVADDPSTRADIKSMHFRADDPNTWGYTAPSRRVWGLNVSAGRLYYAVADGPEIWSVAIKADGDFGDARREIIVPADQGPFEISDISFDGKGWIYLAQRPPVTGNYDYLFLAAAAPAKVLRYKPDPATNSWTQVPDEYHVGLTAERRQTDGGVALGYGYTPDGKMDYGTCDGTLWTTGDDLDRSPRKTANVGKSDATDGSTGLNVSGLQGSPTDPNALNANTLRFTDYDGIMPAAQTRGHVGDVRVFRACGSPDASASPVPVEQEPADTIDLQVEKIARGACRLDGICHVEIKIWNRSNQPYFGPLTIAETLDKAGARMVDSGPSRWQCGQGGADVSCHHPGVDIGVGLSTSIFLDYRLPGRWSFPEFADCADIAWLGDFDSPQTIVAVEIELARLGLYTGNVDRIYGPQLQQAIVTYGSTHGLGQDGVINAELIESLFGRGSAIPHDRVKVHERSCATFHIDVPTTITEVYTPPPPVIEYPVPPILVPPIIVNSCPYGYWNRGGDCVRSCPWGFRAFGDRCFPEGGPVCRDGWFNGGACTCPSGFVGIQTDGGRIICRPRPGGPGGSCFGGFQEGNRCLCPAGTRPEGVNGSIHCVRAPIACDGGALLDGQCRCRIGEFMRNGRCEPVGVHPFPIGCPPGQINIGGVCRPNGIFPGGKVCPPGEFPIDGVCRFRPIGPVGPGGLKPCPGNEILINGVCRPGVIGPVNPGGLKPCPGNEILVNGVCRPGGIVPVNPGGLKVCPGNEILVNGVCRPGGIVPVNPGGLKVCPGNEILVNGVCRPGVLGPVNPGGQKTCPANEVFINGACKPVNTFNPGGNLNPGVNKTCPGNEVLINGVCQHRVLQGNPGGCPFGEVKRGNGCVPVEKQPIHPNLQNPVIHNPGVLNHNNNPVIIHNNNPGIHNGPVIHNNNPVIIHNNPGNLHPTFHPTQVHVNNPVVIHNNPVIHNNTPHPVIQSCHMVRGKCVH